MSLDKINEWLDSPNAIIHSIDEFYNIINGENGFNAIYRIPDFLIPELKLTPIELDEIDRDVIFETIDVFGTELDMIISSGSLPVVYDNEFAEEQSLRWNQMLLSRVIIPEDEPVDEVRKEQVDDIKVISALLEKTMTVTAQIEKEMLDCIFATKTGVYIDDRRLDVKRDDYISKKLAIRESILVDIVNELADSNMLHPSFKIEYNKLDNEFQNTVINWTFAEQSEKILYENRMISIVQRLLAKMQTKIIAKDVIQQRRTSESLLPEINEMQSVI